MHTLTVFLIRYYITTTRTIKMTGIEDPGLWKIYPDKYRERQQSEL